MKPKLSQKTKDALDDGACTRLELEASVDRCHTKFLAENRRGELGARNRYSESLKLARAQLDYYNKSRKAKMKEAINKL